MKISLGPMQFYWRRAAALDFYRRVAQAPVDIVYLGETVCSKRRELTPEDWLEVAQNLAQAGKQVVMSTLALIEAESELSSLRHYCDNGRFLVEANDMAAVQLMSEHGLPFVAGPTINNYNASSLAILHRGGLRRWVMPVELSAQALRDILAELAPLDLAPRLETEVFAHGYLPLAYSARCFTARANNLPKDRCEFRCIEYPQGMPLTTQDGRPLFTVNGIQTMSGLVHNLCARWQDLAAAGADILRISPQGDDTLELVAELAAAIREGRPAKVAGGAGHDCNGYWQGASGMDWQAR
ncbi:MAG: U32 family peptidase [Gammaproteobacteria bacterium]|nr:U32 family peptidase [Gammaproteobacteria bacterium]